MKHANREHTHKQANTFQSRILNSTEIKNFVKFVRQSNEKRMNKKKCIAQTTKIYNKTFTECGK